MSTSSLIVSVHSISLEAEIDKHFPRPIIFLISVILISAFIPLFHAPFLLESSWTIFFSDIIGRQKDNLVNGAEYSVL